MNQFLIFRTDRIGDFILTSILIKSIKRNNPNSKIIVICSKKNIEYIKKFSLIDEAIIYPESFFKKISFYFSIIKKKIDYSLCLDGKKRSIFAAYLSNAKVKIFTVTKKIYKTFLFNNKNNVLLFDEFPSRIEEFKSILSKLNFNFLENDLNIFENENISTNQNKLKSITNNKYNLLHLDEKWITEAYKSKKGIRNFKPINATSDQILTFSKDLINKSKINLVISTGKDHNKLIIDLKKKFNNQEFIEFDKKKIFLLDGISFFDLKYVIKNSNLIITCHGSPSHVASAFKTKIIDIFDRETENFYKFYTAHLRNYNYVYRDHFNIISKDIINKI